MRNFAGLVNTLVPVSARGEPCLDVEARIIQPGPNPSSATRKLVAASSNVRRSARRASPREPHQGCCRPRCARLRPDIKGMRDFSDPRPSTIQTSQLGGRADSAAQTSIDASPGLTGVFTG
jgi:hypothetical protein